jgi:predicted TIM-barrel fold metal-dependent hydrolase
MKGTKEPGGQGGAIIDSHAHVWTLDTTAYPWRPTFGIVPTDPAPPDELLAAMDDLGIARAILVQPSVYGPDHGFLFDTVRRHPDRFSPLGLVDPAVPASRELAEGLVGKGCVGLRVNLALDLRQARRQAEAESWRLLGSLGVPICLRATPAHHVLATRIVERHPSTRFVIDHLGLPEPGQTEQTIARLGDLAGLDNCLLKIAGLAGASNRSSPYRDTWTILAAAHELFGASRLVWGSDYPAAAPGSGYPDAVAAMRAVPFLSDVERDTVMHGTANDLWGPFDR